MLSLLALVFTSHSLGETKPQVAEVPSRIPIQGYMPSHLPIVLSKLAPKSVNAQTSSIRGFRSIALDWEVKKTQDAVTAELGEGYDSKGFGHSDTGGRWNTLHLSDRTITIYTQPGRLVPAPSPFPNQRAAAYVDRDTYTHVSIFEWPLVVGPTPSNWPEKAKNAIPMPANAPSIPIAEIQRVPEVISYNNLIDIGEYYNFTWYVKEHKATAYPRWTEILEKSGNWDIQRHVNGTTFWSKKGKPYIQIFFQNYDSNSLPIPKDWCSVNMSWQVKAP